MESFNGRLAVVTGGGSGMGRQLVIQLAADGCSVATCDVNADSLAETQQLMTRALPQSFETNAGIAGELAGLAISGQPLDWHQGYVAGVRAITAAQARDSAAARWKDPSIVIVGDAAKLAEGLGTLGLPVVRYDTDGRPAK